MSAKHKREIGIGLTFVVIAFFGWFVVIPLGIDLPSQIDIDALAPDFWPRIVMLLLAACGVVIVGQGYVAGRQPTHAEEAEMVAEADGTAEFPLAQRSARVAFALVAMFVFYFAIDKIGIVVASAFVIVVFTYVLGQRRWTLILPLAVILPAALYVFFVHVASVPMPLGVFEALR